LGVCLILLATAGLAFSPRSMGSRVALVGILMPITAVWVISQRRPVYVDRYFVVLLPMVVALVALGAAAVAQRMRPAAPFRGALALATIVVALSGGLTVHTAGKFNKEDWRGLVAFLHSRGVRLAELSLSEQEVALPLSYYYEEGLIDESLPIVPECSEGCWWVLRQPYTATHALTQSVQEVGRGGAPSVPEMCEDSDSWQSPTRIALGTLYVWSEVTTGWLLGVLVSAGTAVVIVVSSALPAADPMHRSWTHSSSHLNPFSLACCPLCERGLGRCALLAEYRPWSISTLLRGWFSHLPWGWA
jgi:hypothetical protein